MLTTIRPRAYCCFDPRGTGVTNLSHFQCSWLNVRTLHPATGGVKRCDGLEYLRILVTC
jgi:hypothetical protein